MDVNGTTWLVDWATDTDVDPRLVWKERVGAVTAAAFGAREGRPSLAVGVRAHDAGTDRVAYRLKVLDVLSGQWRERSCAEQITCLSFASADVRLVSGHRGGVRRIWDLRDLAAIATLDGGDNVVDVCVAGVGTDAQVVTRDEQRRLRRWRLLAGDELSVPAGAVASTICAGQLSDGRRVVVLAGDSVSLWDLGRDEVSDLPLPEGSGRIRGATLSIVNGRECVTLVDEVHAIRTIDLGTGRQPTTSIDAHRNRRPDGLMRTTGFASPHPKLAAVAGTLAMPTPWRVHLWDLATARPRSLPLAGPVAYAEVQAVRWDEREMLLTMSARDGFAALWDLDRPLDRRPGHDQRICRIALVDDTVVSADEGGTLLAREIVGGRLAAAPLATGIEGTRALTAWRHEDELFAATGAGSNHVSDGTLRLWNLTTGTPHGTPVKAQLAYLHWLSLIELGRRAALVTFGPGRMLKIFSPDDGHLLAEVRTDIPSKVTGFATGVVDGATFAAISSYSQPMTVYDLTDLAKPPLAVAGAGRERVLAFCCSRILTAGGEGRNILRAWDLRGHQVGRDVVGPAEIVSAAPAKWPVVFAGHANGSVSVVDVATGSPLAAPLSLPLRPNDLAVTGSGDLVIGSGSDLVRVRPPAGT